MGAGEFTLFESGIWIIPLVLIGSLVGMYALVRAWQKRTQQDLKAIQAELRHFHTRFRQLDLATQNYSSEDREPFGSQAKTLAGRLERIGQRIGLQQQRYVSLRENTGRLNVKGWQLFVAGPSFLFRWLSFRQEINSLRKDSNDIRAAFDATQEAVQTLARRGWEVAVWARSVAEKDGRLQQALTILSERRVHGDTFEDVLHQKRQLDASLEKIPPYFLSASEEIVLAQADKECIADVHELLGEVEPVIDGLVHQVEEWETQFQETSSRVVDVRRTLDEVRNLLPALPEDLILEPYEARLNQLDTIANTLHATLSRLEIESMPQVAQEADRVRVAAQEIGEGLKRARRQWLTLGRLLEELDAGLKTISAQFAELGTSPVHPVTWSQSRARLTELSRQVSALGGPKKPRLPEQVDKDLAAASALFAQQKELARHCQAVAEGHKELLKLLESPEVKDAPGWFESAGNIASQVGLYAAENWPRGDAVATLRADLESLASRHERLVSPDLSEPFSETEVSAELEAMRALVSQHQSLRVRMERVVSRLANLQDYEKGLRERFQAARMVLNQVDLLARSNDFLNEIAMAEIGSFRSQLEQRGAEVGQRRQGLVEEKARLLSALISQIEAAANGWLERLNGDIELKKKTIAEKLEALNEIGTLDEKAVVEAQSLLSQDLSTSVVPRSKQKPSFPLDEIVAQMKPRSDTWQSCLAILRGLGDIEKPLVETYQHALEQYETAKEQLTNGVRWVPARGSWPPTSISLENEVQEFKNVEAQWQAIENQPNRAISIVRQLSDLSSRLQAVAERTSQKVDRAEQEQNRIRDLESELEELSRRWQSLAREVPEATGEIRGLIVQIGREVDGLKRQYRQGALSYSQVLQSLNFLSQNVRNEQITLEDGRSVRLDHSAHQNYRPRF